MTARYAAARGFRPSFRSLPRAKGPSTISTKVSSRFRWIVGWQTGEVTSEELLELISIDPNVCHGQPCIKGTRVLVTVVLDALAAGLSASEIVRHYPTIDEEGVRAAAAYGAWLAKQEIHGLPAGS
jgi:uncharacterized protein (DUF433 family)